jgi:hypothetical protein
MKGGGTTKSIVTPDSARALAAEGAPVGARGPRGRGRWVTLGIVAVVAAGAVSAGSLWALRAGVFSPAAPGSGPGSAAATAAVTRQYLIATTPQAATLGYAQVYTVTGQGGGTLTWLPPPGTVIRQGRALYQTGDGSPVALLYGTVPDWRALYEGMTGQDVSQLNHDLVGLGYADRSDVVLLGWDYYSWETAIGVQELEEHLGVSWPPGSLSLGQVVFEPEALRVSQLTGSLGGSATGPVLTATSDRQVVTIPLDVSEQSEVRAGNAVSVTLPDGTTTPGVVSSVGTVVTAPGSGGTAPGSPGNPAPTIPVQVTLTDPGAAGTLDQAPVTVNITTQSSPGLVLAVPVTALLAQSPGGYAVEVAGPGSTRRWVRVTPGIYDGANGLVQVTGALTPGERVVVAAS